MCMVVDLGMSPWNDTLDYMYMYYNMIYEWLLGNMESYNWIYEWILMESYYNI